VSDYTIRSPYFGEIAVYRDGEKIYDGPEDQMPPEVQAVADACIYTPQSSFNNG